MGAGVDRRGGHKLHYQNESTRISTSKSLIRQSSNEYIKKFSQNHPHHHQPNKLHLVEKELDYDIINKLGGPEIVSYSHEIYNA